MTESQQRSSAGGNSVAPFQERLSSSSHQTDTKYTQAQGSATSARNKQQQRQSQPTATTHHHSSSRQRIKQALQPISAVRAVAKVAAAEAAVSAAAAALVPSSKAAEPEPERPAAGLSHRVQQPHAQQSKPQPRHQASVSTPGGDPFLQVAGTQVAGPCRSSSMPGSLRRATAEAAAGCTSSSTSSMQPSVHASLTGALQATQPYAAGPAEAPAQGQEVALLPLSYAADLQQPSAAAQLAAYGLSKRIRAQLRSAHGPPAFQRSTLPPRPASPPPVVLDGGMLLDCNPDACSPAGVVMADLSSCNISSISSQPALPAGWAASQTATAAGAAASLDQQLSLQSFSSLVLLDLSDNRLDCFAGLAVLPSLQQLSLAANRLRSLHNLWPPPLAAAAQHRSTPEKGRQGTAGSRGFPLNSDDGDGDGGGRGEDGSGHASQQPHHEGSSSMWVGIESGAGGGADAAIQFPGSCIMGSVHDAQAAGPSSEPSQQQQEEKEEQEVQHPDEQAADSLPAVQQQQPQRPEQELRADPLQQHPGQAGGSPAAAPWTGALQCAMPPLLGFDLLEVLDVSFNMLSGEVLLGLTSPLGFLPRLCELHAAGNGISTLPQQLAPFTTLSLLRLPHNQLQMAAVAILAQLPALQLLDLSHNPLATSAPGTQQRPGPTSTGGAQCLGQGTGAVVGQDGLQPAGSFPQLLVLDLSSSRVKQVEPVQELLGCMQGLAELRLADTPLAERCRAGKVQEQHLQRPGLTVVLSSSSSSSKVAQQQPGKQHLIAPGPLLRIPDAATPSKVLAAASKAALVALPHEQLVAAFDRVTAGIDSWQQLAPVLEEDGSWEWQGEGSGQQDSGGVQPAQPEAAGGEELLAAADEEQVEDRTFLTGVGITGELPGGPGATDAAASSLGPCSDQQCSWQDPTERLALALGLQLSQLAHMTGIIPGNPDGALHRLRHALAHPLVDPDAGQRPQQHHMRSTAATAAKQQSGRVVPLPQPISASLSTRVQPVQDLGVLLKDMRSRLDAMQGTLLPQLQAQATKLAPGTAG